MEQAPASNPRRFPCAQCGAALDFAPGTTVLRCPYCQHEQAVARSEEIIEERDYVAALVELGNSAPKQEQRTTQCRGCAAEIVFGPTTTATHCPWCGDDLVLEVKTVPLLQVQGLLPFQLKPQNAAQNIQNWLKTRWFAPSRLKEVITQKLQGCYLPFFTYDAQTVSAYVGERGDDHTHIEHYTRKVNGRSVSATRTRTHTVWTSVSGVVNDSFDDILIPASTSLPVSLQNSLDPWPLSKLESYSQDWLAGFSAEAPSVSLRTGFDTAHTQYMDPAIRSHVTRAIGGNHQRIHSISTNYNDITFKHILLPVWVSSYRWQGKPFRILVNAQTGEVQGQRPYSAWKIAFLVLAILALIAVITMVVMNRTSSTNIQVERAF
jgi:predicted RNA-binding Zn-ribbon protein involved in translation (DUF1610 family)